MKIILLIQTSISKSKQMQEKYINIRWSPTLGETCTMVTLETMQSSKLSSFRSE